MAPDSPSLQGSDTPQAAALRCGVAGWSYPDWTGCVYPPGLKDPLEYLSGFVDLVEINSTFYRPPSLRNTRSWAQRTEGRQAFLFSAKVHQDVTHGQKIEKEVISAFREGLAPLVEAGRLTHLLAQFRFDFNDTPRNRSHLQAVREHFGGITELVLELRHNTWQSPAALEFLRQLGVTVANLDYPVSRDAFTLRECNVGVNGYLRLHGRNRAAWFDKRAGRDETYDYLYSAEEIEGILDRIRLLTRHFRSLTVVANNHYRGKEVANILEIKSRLEGRPVAVPPLLLEEYPRLAAIAE